MSAPLDPVVTLDPVEAQTVEGRWLLTLGFIDQTIYANEDGSPDLTWTNAEVLELLAMIRGTLTGEIDTP